jgi:catechol 2,3-dioxygenase-like lactoylglutathione lyase family enzyme
MGGQPDASPDPGTAPGAKPPGPVRALLRRVAHALRLVRARVRHRLRLLRDRARHRLLLARDRVWHQLLLLRDRLIRTRMRLGDWLVRTRYRAALARHRLYLLRDGALRLPHLTRRLALRLHGTKLLTFHHHPPRPLRVPAGYHRPRPLPAPPLISVVTPSYNQGRFLEQTIRSVLDQGYPRLEYVVQDGGSTDDSVAVMEKYRGRLAHAESRRDNGQGHAINLGFAHATRGEVMAYLNSDDLLLPGALNYVAAYFAAHPEVDVVYGHRVVVDPDGNEVGRWVLPGHSDRMLVWADYVPQETMFWRRRIWDKVGGKIDESFRFALDWDLLLRFREAGARFVRLPRFLGAFRVHPTQKTSADLESAGNPEMARLRRRVHGRDPDLSEIGPRIRGYLFRHAWHDWLRRLGLAHR